ncbi:MAG: alpha-amylase family glycosyl hydrolase [Anaerolineae bacterium]
MSKPQLSRPVLFLLLLLAAMMLALASSVPTVSAAPASVSLVGNFENAATGGACADWTPACAAAHLTDKGNGVWRGAFSVPAQSDGQYKMALDDSWNVSYAGNHTKFGNTTLVTGATQTVVFYYDDKTHAVLDNVMDKVATVAGDFQSKIGCPGDWQPDCVRSLMVDPDGDGIYMFETTSIPVGSYQFKVARDEQWNTSYPGGNVTFSVTKSGQDVRFYWDSSNNNVWVVAGHAHDNNVEWKGLAHDSRDLLYRTPGGAVPAGTPVKIRFRTFHNDVTSVDMRLYDINAGGQSIVAMQMVASDVSCYDAGLVNDSCDFWEATLSQGTPNNFWYRFIIRDGTSTAYYGDDTAALDGGIGAPSASVVDNSWALMFYDPKFSAPAWMQDAVIYQIFPDRFRNGNTANDPKKGDPRYNDPVITIPWGKLPEGYCRNYAGATAANCPWRFDPTMTGIEQPRGRDYYGGDLKGVTQELAYLKSLGVNTIYFNPIFDAQSNHGYDTADYKKIDPYFGTLADFQNLVKAADANNMHIVLDGVFNHMSSDSPNFDRYHHYAGLGGACENVASPFRGWFTFRAPSGSEPSTCVPSTPGGSDTYYNGWFGFDSIPVLTKSLPAVQQYFVTGPNSVSKYWLQQGATGWRLDVMGDSSFPNGYWETFRKTVKATNGNAVIIGELWQKDSTLLRFLRGDRADSTMDYRLRDALLGWLAPQNFDSKGFADGGHYPGMNAIAARLLSIREDYPDAAYFSLMNLLDSHDTERALWTLTPGNANPQDREQNAANLAAGKLNLKIASMTQFSLGGAPTVYYGDEVGMTGDTDPDDRRTYPWADKGGNPDGGLLKHYQTLAEIRRVNPVLRDGDLRVLMTDESSHTLVLGRKTNHQAAIFVGGNGGTFDIPVAGYIHDGVVFHSAYAVNNAVANVTVTGGKVHVALANKGAVLLLTTQSVDLLPPAAPAGLAATSEGDGQVSLSWTPVTGATGYNIYYSPVSGGGWVKANTTPVVKPTLKLRIPTNKNYTTTGLTNGDVYYFVVRALDNVGNESKNSNQVSALPHYTIGWANTQWPPTISQTISAVNMTPNVYGQVYIAGVTNQPGPTPSLRAQLGFGPHATNPASSAQWKWIGATFNTDSGNNDEFKAQMLPDTVGDYDYLYRYTTTNGRDWLYADFNGPISAGAMPPNPGRMTVSASSDTTPPATPANLTVVNSSPTDINLKWDAVTGDPTMYGYEVLRGNTTGGPYTILALVTTTTYDDNSVVQGATYYYVVRAVDQSYNRSGYSNEVQATANPRKVHVVFNVTVPSYTDASGKTVHIAGTLSRLDGGMPDWDPGAVALTRVDSTHWTITLTGNETTQIEYKYALGSWDYVEKDGACGEINNRTLTLTYGATGTQTVNETVQNWRNGNQFGGTCGN